MPSPVRWSTAFLDPSLRISREADGTVSVYSKARVRYAALPCMWRAYAYKEEDGTPLTPPPCSLRWSRQTRRLPSRGLPRRRWSLRKWRRKSKTPGHCGIGLTTGGARPRLGVTPTSPEHCGDPDHPPHVTSRGPSSLPPRTGWRYASTRERVEASGRGWGWAGGEVHVAVRPCQRTAGRGSSERREGRFAVARCELRAGVACVRVRA